MILLELEVTAGIFGYSYSHAHRHAILLFCTHTCTYTRKHTFMHTQYFHTLPFNMQTFIVFDSHVFHHSSFTFNKRRSRVPKALLGISFLLTYTRSLVFFCLPTLILTDVPSFVSEQFPLELKWSSLVCGHI